jgi:hypothetical protein
VRILIPRTAIASAALLAAVGFGIAAAGPAAASASPALPDSPGGDISITGTMPGADTDCTDHHWIGNGIQAGSLGIGGSSWVEWTSNTCGYLIQERSWCVSQDGSGFWSTSGVVKETGLLDSSSCGADSSHITRGEERTSSDGGSTWTTYTTFWTPP